MNPYKILAGIFAATTGFMIGHSLANKHKKKPAYSENDIIGKVIVNPEDSDMMIMFNNDPADIDEGIYKIKIEKTKYVGKLRENDIVN